MKKAILLFVALLAIGTTQAQDFEKGGKYITLGYGVDPLGHNTNGLSFLTSDYKRTSLGPSILAFEYGVTDILGIGRIGAGGAIAHSIFTQKWTTGSYEYKDVRQRISLIVRGAYHFEFGVDKMDVYASVGPAIHYYVDRESDNAGYSSAKVTSINVTPYAVAGIRYYFTDFFGVYAEAGYGLAALNGGIVLSF